MHPETEADLIARYERVGRLHKAALQEHARMPPGNRRDNKARWAGSLQFTLLQIESELRDREQSVHFLANQ